MLRFTRHLEVTDHAVERYVERVRPALTFHKAKIELLRLVRYEGIILDGRPHGLSTPPSDVEWFIREPTAYVELGSGTGIYCVVQGRTVVTVMCRAGLSEYGRARRNEKKAKRRRHQANIRAEKSWRGESNPRWR